MNDNAGPVIPETEPNVDDATPIEVEEVPGDGEQPPEGWGDQGEGNDVEDVTSEAVPQNEDQDGD